MATKSRSRRDLMRAAINGLDVNATPGLQQKGEITFISDTEAEVTYTGVTPGSQTVTASYKGGTEKSTTILVREEPSRLDSIEPVSFERILGEEQIIELLFTKPVVDGQGYPTVQVSENLEYSTPFIINGDKTGGSIGITGISVGTGTVDIQMGGVVITANATILEVPAELLTVTAQPEVFNVDDITEVIAEHDKTPVIENVTFTQSAGLEEVEAPVVVGTTVRAKYKGTATGAQRVDVQSFKLSKSVLLQVNPKPIVYPVLQALNVSPTDVLVGKTVNLEILFDKTEHLYTADISVLIPEGVTEVTPLTINEGANTATATYTVEQAGTKEFSVSYKDVTKTKSFTAIPLTVISALEADVTDLYVGDEATLTANFDKALEEGQADPKLVVGDGLQIKTEFTMNAQRNGGTAVVKAIAVPVTRAEGTTTATITLGNVSKQVEFTIAEKPAVLQKIAANKTEIRKNSDVIVTTTFDKTPELDNVTFDVPNGLNVKVAPKVVGNTIVATYVSTNTVGAMKIVAKSVGVTKEVTINVVADAVVNTAAADKTTIEINEQVAINVTFDKAFVEGQDALTATYSEGIAESSAFTMNSDKTGGTLKVTPSTAGSKTVTLHLGGAEKDVTITVLPAVQPTSIVASETELEIGEKSLITVTFNRAITDASLVTVQIPAGLTGATTLTLIEEGAKGTVEVTAKTAGNQTVTVQANGASKSVDINVLADPKLLTVTADPEEGYVNETDFDVVASFDKAIVLSEVTVTPGSGLTQVTAPALDGNNKVKATYKGTTVGNRTVDVAYRGQKKTATFAVVEKPAKLTNMTADKTEFLTVAPGDIKLTLTFADNVPSLDDLNITASETNFTKKGEPTIKGQTVEAVYTTLAAENENATITAEYLGVTKTVNVKIIAPATVSSVVFDKTTDVQAGDEIVATVTMSKAMPAAQVTPTFASTSGLTAKGSPVVNGTRESITQTYTVGTETTEQTITVTAYGTNTTAKVTPVAKAVMSGATAAPATVEIGADSKVTIAFNKAPRLAEVKITADTAKLTEKAAAKIVGNNVEVTYTGKAAGAAKVTAVHNGVTKEATITVNPAYAMSTVVAAPASIAVGADTVVTATFNRAPVLTDATFTPSAGLTEKVAPTVSGNTIKATYTGKTAGAQKVTVGYKGLTAKDAAVTVTEAAPVLQTAVANPTSVLVGADTVVTMTFDKAPELAKVVMTPNANLTLKGSIAVSGNTATATFTGKTAGAGTVACSYDGGTAKTVNVTVTAPDPVFSTATANPTEVTVGADTVVTMTFTGSAPEIGKVVMTPNEFLTQKVAPAVSGMNVTATFTGAAEGAGTVSCTYDGGTAKVANVTVTPSTRAARSRAR